MYLEWTLHRWVPLQLYFAVWLAYLLYITCTYTYHCNKKVCRDADAYFKKVALQMPSCKNVELGGRDGMKTFCHGISVYMRPKIRRINGGWWIAIARMLLVFFCFTELVCAETRKGLCHALRLLLRVHHGLRNPLMKTDLYTYADTITELVTVMMICICESHTASGCHSIKYHWPLHWWLTRREFAPRIYWNFPIEYLVVLIVWSRTFNYFQWHRRT